MYMIVYIIICTVVLFILGAMLGLTPFFVSTKEIPSLFLVLVGFALVVAIACVWYFAPLNSSGVRPTGIVIFAIFFPLAIAWGTYYFSHSDRREIQKNAGPAEQSFMISVDYGQPFSGLFNRDTYGIGFSGADFRDEITPEHFPVKGTGKVEVELTIIKFAEQMPYRAVQTELSKRGQTPARIEHVMALHDLHPDLHLFNQGSIYALGSQWVDKKGEQRVLVLQTERPHLLRANYLKDTSIPDDWFAVIREK